MNLLFALPHPTLRMPKPVILLLIFSLLSGILGACNLPASITLTPTSVPAARMAQATSRPTKTPIATQTPAPTPLPPVHLTQIKMVDSSQGWGWTTRDGLSYQLLRTSDGALHWQDVSPRGNYTYSSSFFLDDRHAWLSFSDPNTGAAGLLRTVDGGLSWVNLPGSEISQNTWLQFSSPEVGIAETAGMGAGSAYLNYYQTQDGGATWKPVPILAPNPDQPEGTVHLCNICGDTLYYDSARLIIAYGDMASEPVGFLRLSVSVDLGKHWQELKIALPEKYAAGSVMPFSPTFFGSDGVMPINLSKSNPDGTPGLSALVMYMTHDGGLSWQAAPALLESDRIQVDAVQVLSPKVAFVRCGRNLCATQDGAQTWQKLPDNLNFDQSAGGPDYISQYTFIDAMNGWAISGESGSSLLWHTTDGGKTWQKVKSSS